ncbi:hypothetical protein CBL_08952 [Carabus blaptoides fortunei]
MDKIDTLFKNPCFGKASIGRNLKKHLELTPDVLLQNLCTRLDGTNNSPVKTKLANSDEELLTLDDSVFMTHPRYFTEERESSRIPITGATCVSLSIKEKFTTEKHSIHISEESVYDNKTRVELAASPQANKHVVNPRITEDTNRQTENRTDTDIMDTKLNGTLLKISSVLQEISAIIYNGIQPIESDGDNSRRQKRVTEFFSRFTRNYLYQLVRQLSDVRKLLGRPTSCRSPQTGGASSLLVQDKLSSVSQTVMQALQAYSHHVPLTVASSAHSKCLSLVAYIREMCKLLRKLLAAHAHTVSCVHSVEQHTNTLVDAITVCLLVSTDDTGRGTRVSLATVSNKSTSTAVRTTSVPFHKRQSLDKRLAMYNTSCVGWKRSATILAKQRFNVQSRYKLGTYKPPMHSEARTCLTTSAHLTATSKKSLGERRAVHSPVNSRVHEDNIPTMVQLELQKERQQQQQQLKERKHKTRATHTATSSDDDRVQPEKPVVDGARKKQEDNFKTMLQYLLVQLQQQDQHSSKVQ